MDNYSLDRDIDRRVNIRDSGAARYGAILYALYGVGLFTVVGYIPFIILYFLKRGDVSATFVESHFRWIIRTFIFQLIWGFFGGLLIFIKIGFVILFITWAWCIYRLIKGVLALVERNPLYR